MFAPTETDRTAEQARMLMPFGFIERQARFLTLRALEYQIIKQEWYRPETA